MITAVFPGSFDPPTYGHLNIIERTSRLFDKIDVVISINPDKKYLFSETERYEMLKELTEMYDNVEVHTCNTLIVNYCRKVDAKVLLRGIRNTNDFSYEFDLSLINKSIDGQIETLFVPTEQRFFLIRSSSIKEVARYGGLGAPELKLEGDVAVDREAVGPHLDAVLFLAEPQLGRDQHEIHAYGQGQPGPVHGGERVETPACQVFDSRP